METQFLKYNYSTVYKKLNAGEMSYDEFLEFVNYLYQFGKEIGHSYGKLEVLQQMMKE